MAPLYCRPSLHHLSLLFIGFIDQLMNAPSALRVAPPAGQDASMKQTARGSASRRIRGTLAEDNTTVVVPKISAEEITTFYPPIGEGAFSKVYKGRCRGKDVAIKVLDNIEFDANILEEFISEVEIMAHLLHPNILLLMGACVESHYGENNWAIVTEFMPRGDLYVNKDSKKGNEHARGQSPALIWPSLTCLDSSRDLSQPFTPMGTSFFIFLSFSSFSSFLFDFFNSISRFALCSSLFALQPFSTAAHVTSQLWHYP